MSQGHLLDGGRVVVFLYGHLLDQLHCTYRGHGHLFDDLYLLDLARREERDERNGAHD
jgi:hypothetical protein